MVLGFGFKPSPFGRSGVFRRCGRRDFGRGRTGLTQFTRDNKDWSRVGWSLV